VGGVLTECGVRFADRSAFPEPRRARPSGGGGGLPGGFVRGHQLVCHPRKEGDDHAQGHPAGEENQGGEGLGRVSPRRCIEKSKKKKKKSLGFFRTHQSGVCIVCGTMVACVSWAWCLLFIVWV
jgi:hypothetical protein